jgi:hypothetical protein
LGFALEDQRAPDWRAAEAALTEAIRRRGPAERGWLLYEFNRAICRVRLDTGASAPSSPEVQASVPADIEVVGLRPALQQQLCGVARGGWSATAERPLIGPEARSGRPQHPGDTSVTAR